MLTLNVAGTKIFMSKFFSAKDADAMMEAIGEEAPRRVVFIDTPATSFLRDLIQRLRELDVEVVVRDHHDVPTPRSERDEQIKAAAQAIREILGDAATISSRETHPACSTLVEAGEFCGERTVIVADPDPDGLTATMKALDVIYDQLDADAAVLDGARTQQTAEHLSELAVLLVKGMATLPPFNPKFPQTSEDAMSKLFDEFARAAGGGKEAKAALETRVEAYEAAVKEAERLAGTVTLLIPGVVMVDTVGNKPYDLTTLARLIETEGVKVTVVRKNNGPIKPIQFSLAVVKSAQETVNLMSLKPDGVESSPASGIISNIPVLLHCSEAMWTETIRPGLEQMLTE
ncbi:MAG: hypothetical protein ABII72_02065 [Parcubacteria group bacterium]